MNYQQLLNKLENKEPFSLIRWWDWERLSVFDCEIDHYAADWTLYYPEQWEALRKILRSNPKYYMWMQTLGYWLYKKQIDEYLKQIKSTTQWIDSDLLHNQSWNSELTWFFEVLNNNNVIIIWPERLKWINKLIHYTDYIEIPLTTAFLSIDEIEQKIRSLLEWREYSILLFAAAATSNILIDRLYKDYGHIHTMIDIWSVFEPYVWLSTRKYHKNVLDRISQNG